MYSDFMQDEFILPDFDDINDLQLFDGNFQLDYPFDDINDVSASFN